MAQFVTDIYLDVVEKLKASVSFNELTENPFGFEQILNQKISEFKFKITPEKSYIYARRQTLNTSR